MTETGNKMEMKGNGKDEGKGQGRSNLGPLRLKEKRDLNATGGCSGQCRR